MSHVTELTLLPSRPSRCFESRKSDRACQSMLPEQGRLLKSKFRDSILIARERPARSDVDLMRGFYSILSMIYTMRGYRRRHPLQRLILYSYCTVQYGENAIFDTIRRTEFAACRLRPRSPAGIGVMQANSAWRMMAMVPNTTGEHSDDYDIARADDW